MTPISHPSTSRYFFSNASRTFFALAGWLFIVIWTPVATAQTLVRAIEHDAPPSGYTGLPTDYAVFEGSVYYTLGADAYRYDPRTQNLTMLPPANTAVQDMGVFRVFDGALFVTGSIEIGGELQTHLFRYDPAPSQFYDRGVGRADLGRAVEHNRVLYFPIENPYPQSLYCHSTRMDYAEGIGFLTSADSAIGHTGRYTEPCSNLALLSSDAGLVEIHMPAFGNGPDRAWIVDDPMSTQLPFSTVLNGSYSGISTPSVDESLFLVTPNMASFQGGLYFSSSLPASVIASTIGPHRLSAAPGGRWEYGTGYNFTGRQLELRRFTAPITHEYFEINRVRGTSGDSPNDSDSSPGDFVHADGQLYFAANTTPGVRHVYRLASSDSVPAVVLGGQMSGINRRPVGAWKNQIVIASTGSDGAGIFHIDGDAVGVFTSDIDLARTLRNYTSSETVAVFTAADASDNWATYVVNSDTLTPDPSTDQPNNNINDGDVDATLTIGGKTADTEPGVQWHKGQAVPVRCILNNRTNQAVTIESIKFKVKGLSSNGTTKTKQAAHCANKSIAPSGRRVCKIKVVPRGKPRRYKCVANIRLGDGKRKRATALGFVTGI